MLNIVLTDRLWAEAKETESLLKLINFLNNMSPCEKRNKLLCEVQYQLDLVTDSATACIDVEQKQRISDLENQVETLKLYDSRKTNKASNDIMRTFKER